MIGALLLSACKGTQQANASDARVDFDQIRPGDAVDRYLGQNLPPSHWTTLESSVNDALMSCMGRKSVDPEAGAGGSLEDVGAEMRGKDLASYRAQYGYGVVERVTFAQLALSKSAQIETSSSTPTPAELHLAEQCEQSVSGLIEATLPRAEIHKRFQTLLAAEVATPLVQSAFGNWIDCMKTQGFDTTTNPLSSRVIVETKVAEFMQQQRPLDGNEADSFAPVDLPQRSIDELHTFEVAVFTADSKCLDSSGAGKLLLEREQILLNELRQQFPDFKGVMP
jgi:hypothetical protein